MNHKLQPIRELLKDQLVDTHAHLTMQQIGSSLQDTLLAAEQAGVTGVWNMAISVENSQQVQDQATTTNVELKRGAAIDPELLIPSSEEYVGRGFGGGGGGGGGGESESESEGESESGSGSGFEVWMGEQRQKLNALLQTGKVDIVGECGMDSFHIYKDLQGGRITKTQFDLSLQRQERLFRMQCELASDYNLPLSIHSRNLEKRVLQIVSEYSVSAVFHSYTGGFKVARKIIEQGYFLGVNGIITYPAADTLRQMYLRLLNKSEKEMSISWFYDQQIVFETDSPWLAPHDSTQLNTPARVVETIDFLRGILKD